MRYNFYAKYLKKHSEIKNVVISDDDMLFFRDPFPLIIKDPKMFSILWKIYILFPLKKI